MDPWCVGPGQGSSKRNTLERHARVSVLPIAIGSQITVDTMVLIKARLISWLQRQGWRRLVSGFVSPRFLNRLSLAITSELQLSRLTVCRRTQ